MFQLNSNYTHRPFRLCRLQSYFPCGKSLIVTSLFCERNSRSFSLINMTICSQTHDITTDTYLQEQITLILTELTDSEILRFYLLLLSNNNLQFIYFPKQWKFNSASYLNNLKNEKWYRFQNPTVSIVLKIIISVNLKLALNDL